MEQATIETTNKGITGSTLKLIAVITMMIDHTAATILTRMLIAKGYYDVFLGQDTAAMIQFSQENMGLIYTMTIMRLIGRIAFPIFCFLLVEGFLHTRSVKKYAIRLGIFALISEIPLNLAIGGSAFYLQYQNVMFTLLIGLLVLVGFSYIDKMEVNRYVRIILYVVIAVAGMAAAVLLKTDYDWSGVLCIVCFYLFRNKRVQRGFLSLIPLVFASAMEIVALVNVPLFAKYNGQRGWKMKYFFYAFYPVHLFVLWLICYLMGTGAINTLM